MIDENKSEIGSWINDTILIGNDWSWSALGIDQGSPDVHNYFNLHLRKPYISFASHSYTVLSLHPASAKGVIVLTSSVCLSVTTLTAERTNIRTWFLVCRLSGRISRSGLKVKVVGQRSRSPGQKMFHRYLFPEGAWWLMRLHRDEDSSKKTHMLSKHPAS